ncbi:MAG: hypothetical protein AAF899_14960 [Pseudomonadota bacterium]
MRRSGSTSSLTAALAAVFGLAACVSTGTPTGSATVDESFSRSAGVFSTGTSIDVALKVQQAGQNLAVCGAWGPRHITGETRRLIRTAAATGFVLVDGRAVLADITNFPNVGEDTALLGATARCLATDRAWQPGLEAARAEARFAPQSYDFEPDNTGVRFRTAR